MHFGFALELSYIDLWDIDLLHTHLDLLDTDIPSKYFVWLDNVFKTSSRHLQDMSLRRLQDMSSRRLQDTSSRCLQDVFRVTIFRLPRRLERCLQDVFARRLQDVLKTFWKAWNCYTLKTCWRRLQDQQMFAG